MSAPTPAPGDDSPREGYYPDPSIPGYVRYWNGASWVPGTSRPAPQQAQAAPVEETGPIFFDEEEDGGAESRNGSVDAGRHESTAEGDAGSVWQADSARQAGFGGERDRRISWGGPASEPATAPADPRTPLAQDPTRGALPGMRDGRRGGGGGGRGPPTEGTVTIRAVGPQAVPHLPKPYGGAPRAPIPYSRTPVRRRGRRDSRPPRLPPPHSPSLYPAPAPAPAPAGGAAGSGPGPGRPPLPPPYPHR
ncbi:DUF2510 domain-containing protein [Streptomyces sp. MT29]|nr:DUF2510 domain-containing protein [Streptomyces sp. MT29]